VLAAQRTTQALLAATVIVAALTLAACGSSSKHTGGETPYGPKSSPYAMSKCFRENGVSGFPDPSAGPSGGVGFNGVGFGSNGSIVVDGKLFNGPVVRAADKACRAFLPSGPPPKLSASQEHQMVAMAECMRTHGVPNFPDPTFANGQPTGPGPQIPANSPAFIQAAKHCGGGNVRIGP
jgi:hypothetical protein